MNTILFSENIIQLRRKRGITQEQLANFIGVTKASVSKWETKQSLPDILLLPQIASFFDVTLDELLGYQPQLSKEQIKKYYHELAADFTKLPFETVMEKCEQLVKKYYSCYPFLLQICVLWLNHFMLADKKRQGEICSSITELCEHILRNCKDIGICNNTFVLKAMVELQNGSYQMVIDSLEEVCNPYHFPAEGPLIQAYLMNNDLKKADSFSQISLFNHLLSLLNTGIQFLVIHAQNWEIAERTIKRLDQIIKTFHIESLHENSAACYHYQAAILFCTYGNPEEALSRLEKFVDLTLSLTKNEPLLHGDDFFNHLEEWFENLDLGPQGVRNRKVIIESALQSLKHPAFATLHNLDKFAKIKEQLNKAFFE